MLALGQERGILLISLFGMKNFNIWFDRIVTKNTVLIVSFLYAAIVYVIEIKNAPPGCEAGWCLTPTADALIPFFYSVIIIIIFTLLTYLLKERIFKTWIRFALVWLVLSGIWVIATPHDTGFAMALDQKSVLTGSLALVFIALSIIFIFVRIIQVYLIKK